MLICVDSTPEIMRLQDLMRHRVDIGGDPNSDVGRIVTGSRTIGNYPIVILERSIGDQYSQLWAMRRIYFI